MSNLDDLKEKVKDTIDSFTDFSQETYSTIEGKAKIIARRAKLTAGITKQKTIIRRNYIAMGETYYELYKNKPAKALVDNCNIITEAKNIIDEYEKELDELKF